MKMVPTMRIMLVFVWSIVCSISSVAQAAEPIEFRVTIDRGPDRGQSFGSLFEVTSDDGSLVVGAGFQNAYNTRYRADRHALQFYIRPANGERQVEAVELPRAEDTLTGAYLFGRDGVVYSTYGGLKSWDAQQEVWRPVTDVGGTQESMRVGTGRLTFGDSTVSYDGRTILAAPELGSYQLFFYAHGYLCFYHVNRGDGPYRPFRDEQDGFSRLYAVPWTTDQPTADLSRAITLRLPIVGETTFAWGQLGKQIVTGSNIGGFYVFENGQWRMILEPRLGVSYQLYSSLGFHDRLLMGQYPTGRVFEYDGQQIRDLAGWPPVMPGVSSSAREAQTTALYGGDLMVGVWPWGELWRYNTDSRQWIFVQRMFDHPEVTDRIVHPYDVENNKHPVGNLWGQRVTSLVTNGPHLFVSTSSKSPFEFDATAFPFLSPEKWKSYGKIYRLRIPGHLSAPTRWTEGSTTLSCVLRGSEMVIEQDGKQLGHTRLTPQLAGQLSGARFTRQIRWGQGIYGPFGGEEISGQMRQAETD